MTRVAEVQVFAYAEPDLKRTLDAYAECQTPSGWELVYKACVTPRGAVARAPADLQDLVARHVDVALEHDVFELLETPPGKLSSRNHAHAAAVDAGVDAIVAGDADAPPLDRDYLEQLLEPLKCPTTVATNARPVAPWTPLGTLTNAAGWLIDDLRPHVNGQGHALDARAWEFAGPFEVDDETDATAVRLEEEFAFRRRLEDLGDVIDVGAARVRNDIRRTRCALRRSFRGLGIDEPAYCRRLGAETFQPRD